MKRKQLRPTTSLAHHYLARPCLLLLLSQLAFLSSPLRAAPPASGKLPSWRKVKVLIEHHFASLPEYAPGDLIHRGQVEKLVGRLAAAGWKVSDAKPLLKRVLAQNDYLVRLLYSGGGQRFMRKVANYPTIYSRLDRVAGESGGEALLRDLVRLPDGHKYAHVKRPRGVPGLTDFLPKRRTSRGRRVKNYDKPTRKVYTVKQLLAELRQIYTEDAKKASTSAKS